MCKPTGLELGAGAADALMGQRCWVLSLRMRHLGEVLTVKQAPAA